MFEQLTHHFRLVAGFLALIVVLFAGRGFTQELPFEEVSLDELILESKSRMGAVEIPPPSKVRFRALVEELPKERSSRYLLHVLSLFGTDPLPSVHQGMVLESPAGAKQVVYVEESAAEAISTRLSRGDQADFFGYWLFKSKHGPGILVSDFETTRSWYQALIDRLQGN